MRAIYEYECPAVNVATQKRHTVLIAEDDLTLAKGLEVNLKREGYNVFRAPDGPAGLNESLRHRPDVILLDVMLPGMNGFDLCRELRRRGSEAIIIIVSVKGQELDRV